jgi:hypothetical protein
MSEVTTFQEDYEQMRQRLVEAGAGERAIYGTVVTDAEQGHSFRAVYRVTEQPPRITQISVTGSTERLTATLTHVGVNEEDEPQIQVGRFTYPLPETADEIYAEVIESERAPRTGQPKGEIAESIFDATYANVVEGFTPDVPSQV